VAVFLVTGAIGVVLKIFIELGHGEEKMAFLGLAFSAAAVISWGTMLIKRAPVGGGDVLRGVLFGGGNMLTNISLLKALESLPGTVAFPLNNSGVIVLTALMGVLFWKEKPGRWGYGAIAAAVFSIILISM
jgi:drug/metabolite transporter (DMT)-like permease